MSKIEQIASVASGMSPISFPLIYHIERLNRAARNVLDPIWSGVYGEEKVAIWRLTDVWVAGIGLVFDDKGEPLRQFILQPVDLVERARTEVYREINKASSEVVLDESMVLLRPGYINYGHWLIEMLPQLLIAQSLIRDFAPKLYIAGNLKQKMDTLCRDSIILLAQPACDVRTYNFRPLLFKSLYLVDGHALHGPYQSPRIYQYLKKGIKYTHNATKRIYVKRSSEYSRVIVNEKDVEDVLQHHGFETILPETLTFEQQRALFTQSEFTLGVAGAGLTNACWQAPGTICMALYPETMIDTFFWWLSQHNGLNFIDLRCQVARRSEGYAAWDGDIRVDPIELDWLIAKILRSL